MAGEYGIAVGINQGLQSVNQGMMNVETIRNNRETMRQNAEKHQASMQTQQVTQDQSKLQIQELQMKLQEFEKIKAKEDAYNAFNAYEETGEAKYLNFAVEKNPLLKSIYTNNNVVTTSSVKDLSAEKLLELGYDENKYIRPIVVTKTDGRQEIQDLTGTYATTGYLKEMRKNKFEDLVMQIKEKQARTIAAQSDVTIATSELNTNLVQDLNSKVESGEITSEQAWSMLNNKGKSAKAEMKPSSIQEAEYFGNLKTKIASGIATPEETATYNSWLTKEGGSGAAMSEKVSGDLGKLQTKGIDLTSPDFNLESLDGKDKAEATTAIRNLENTTAGKKLVNNIAAKLGNGVGAVKATAETLANLVTKDNVSTAVVKEQINQVKSYLPNELKDMTDVDLKDAEFRQAYLSAASVFLKLQSGLTVSEAEAARFATSFGTLNKNTKVNMIGLKTKLEEVIADYESNSVLEPTLYNAKYKAPIEKIKSISTQLEQYIDTPTKSKSTSNYLDGQKATNPNTGEVLTFRSGKGWVKE